MSTSVTILGAGLCGNLLAIMLARRGFAVAVYEREAAPDTQTEAAGRSINLALAARGIRALEQAQAFDAIEALLLPMDGRIVHDSGGKQRFLPYGQHDNERIWSVSRQTLNRQLIGIAQELGVIYHFGHRCLEFDGDAMTATLQAGDETLRLSPELLIAADGAGSVVRRYLVSSGKLTARETLLDHGYVELTIPATDTGSFALEAGGLHIWPRGGFMLIALPNTDRSFTATLFLPHAGKPGFDSIDSSRVAAFFAEEFPDALGCMPKLSQEFATRPVGTLGTIHSEPWSLTGRDQGNRTVLLAGDAAHAIVPFHGQGMNAAFEDCAALVGIVGELGPDWPAVARAFESSRRDDIRAIAEMALENYGEMRDTVRQVSFSERSRLAFRLEQRFPGRFIPRYSMVMFHPEIGYAEAQRRGRIQSAILDQAALAGDAEAAFTVASTLVERKL